MADSQYDAEGKGEEWFYVDSQYDATVKVCWVDSQYDCDLKVFFVDNKYDAGWKGGNKWQQRLA